jgi:hypothetical protein
LAVAFATTGRTTPADFEVVRTPDGVSWLEARDSAAALGGYLAVIDYHAEQLWVQEMLDPGDSVWLGGADVVIEGAWRWVNGAAWDYQLWHHGNPDTSDGADYLQMRADESGHWFAANGLANGFIVEYPCCEGTAGNIDYSGNEGPDVSALVYLVTFMFENGPRPPCFDEADITGRDGINIDDLVYLVSYMFDGGPPPDQCPRDFFPPTDTIEIVDRTGKRWDISYGVHFYGILPNHFNFGLGPYAIMPILDPQFLDPGDPGYPAPDDDFPVLGGLIGGEARAYRLSDLQGREVADDQKDSTYFAAAY